VPILFAAPFLAAAVLGVAFARSRRDAYVLFALGALIGLGLFFAAYLTAPQHSAACSGCEEHWGRSWQPPVAAFLVAVGYLLWLLGIGVGASLHRLGASRGRRRLSG